MKQDPTLHARALIRPRTHIGWLRQAAPFVVAAIALIVLRNQLEGVERADIMSAAFSVSPLQWVAAMAATGLSFWAVGRYDSLLHGLIGTGLPAKAARISGASAIALSQTLGFGVVTGTLVRWRLLPNLGAVGAARVTGLVTVSFLAGWAVFTGLVLIILPAPTPWLRPLAMLAVLGTSLVIAASLYAPRLKLGRYQPRLPSLRAMSNILLLTAIDTVAAAAALYIVMPAGHAPDLAVFLPAFLIALGAGLISGTPGGVGPFEMTFLALMPGTDSAMMLAAILAWRVVYYAAPACLAAIVWLRGSLQARETATKALATHDLAPFHHKAIQAAPRAEALLLYQGDKQLLTSATGTPQWVSARLGQSLVALGDPVQGHTDHAISALIDQAQRGKMAPCLYKCGARTASAARRAGLNVLPIAQEAWLSPAEFDLNTPARRQLRRKLRKASGLTLSSTAPLPLELMARVNQSWARRNGGERGFSMGVFCPDHLLRQHVVLAWHGDKLLGFASFHKGKTEWTLDLMRQSADAPDGTMYAILVRAITDAAAAGIARLSMAAVPYDGPLPHPRLNQLRDRLLPSQAVGLRRFKASFGPRWETLYIAGPSPLALSVSGAEIRREILRGAA